MTGVPADGGGSPAGAGRRGQGQGRDKLERSLRALVVKLSESARSEGQREVMAAMHGVVVVRMLRQAGRPVTIRDVAAATGLPAYTVETALDWLCEEKAAERDMTGRAWRYTATARAATPAGEPASPAGEPVAGGRDGGATAGGGGAVSPAGELVAALAACGVTGEVTGHGVMVAAGEGPGLRVVSAQSAERGWVWSWRYDGRDYRHPRSDAAGAAGKIEVCLSATAALRAAGGVRPGEAP